MSPETFKRLIVICAQIVHILPATLQPIAFERALDFYIANPDALADQLEETD